MSKNVRLIHLIFLGDMFQGGGLPLTLWRLLREAFPRFLQVCFDKNPNLEKFPGY